MCSYILNKYYFKYFAITVDVQINIHNTRVTEYRHTLYELLYKQRIFTLNWWAWMQREISDTNTIWIYSTSH